MSMETAAFKSVATDAIALDFVDRSDAKRAMASTAERALVEREPSPAEFS
jgi:predicted NAD-dependent protein-ADP-ribosyltransferase YbiA (DUF1768 family)